MIRNKIKIKTKNTKKYTKKVDKKTIADVPAPEEPAPEAEPAPEVLFL